jgi:hypothetical protein
MPESGSDVSALERRDPEAAQPESMRDLGRLGRGASGIGDAHVGDQPRAVLDAERQDRAQPPLEERIVAGLGIGHAIAMAERESALADALEDDRIEPPPGDQIDRRLETIGREPGAGAEAEGHGRSPRNAAMISSGSGSSKSSAIQILPLSTSGWRGSRRGSEDSRRATGLPALAMMISSPVATSSTKRVRSSAATLISTVRTTTSGA